MRRFRNNDEAYSTERSTELSCLLTWTVAATMGILFIAQTYIGVSFRWATPDTIATIIGLITPVLVWAIPNRKAT